MDFIVKVLPVRRAQYIKWHAGLITAVPKTAERYPAWFLFLKPKKRKTGRKKLKPLVRVIITAVATPPTVPVIAWARKPLKKRRKKADRSSQGAATFGTYSIAVPALYPSFVLLKAKHREGANRKLLEPLDIFGPLLASPAVYASLFTPKAKHRKGVNRRSLTLALSASPATPIAVIYAALIKPVAKHRKGVSRKRLSITLSASPATPIAVLYASLFKPLAKHRKGSGRALLGTIPRYAQTAAVPVVFAALFKPTAKHRKGVQRLIQSVTPLYVRIAASPAVFASLVKPIAKRRGGVNRQIQTFNIETLVYPESISPSYTVTNVTVTAYRRGYIFGIIRQIGDTFTLTTPLQYSPYWMTIGSHPADWDPYLDVFVPEIDRNILFPPTPETIAVVISSEPGPYGDLQ